MQFLLSTFLWVLMAVSPAYAESSYDTSSEKEIAEAKKQESLRVARVKKREKEARYIQHKISKIDKKILAINSDMNELKHEIEALDEKEKMARKRLSNKLETFNETAIAIARLERIPVEAMAVASSMRAAHIRKGIVEGGRKSLSGQISKNRTDIYELQDIISERKEVILKTEVLKSSRLSEKKQLEKLFSKQVKYLAVDDFDKAKMLKKAYEMKQKKSFKDLLVNYKKTDLYLPKSQSNLKIFPVQGKIIRGYNEADKNGVKSHGVTIESIATEPVTAVKDGRVIYSDSFREYGYIVILEHADGSNSLYSGMDKSDKVIGDFIYTGKIIGYMPNISKPQLYLEIRKGGQTVNPSKYLKENA